MDSILLNILIALLALSITSAITGVYAYLKNDSLSADSIAHSTLPGILIGFMFAGYKSNVHLYLGAVSTGLFSQFLISYLQAHSKLKKDSITAIVLTSLFALGLVLIKYVLDNPTYKNKSGLSHFLFGQAASIQYSDVLFITCISLFVLIIFFFFGRAIKALSFDPILFDLIGWSKTKINFVFDVTLTLTVIIGIQSVGVVLMSALIVTPAVIARALSNEFKKIAFISILANCTCVLLGTFISYQLENPTGPWIIISLSVVCFIALPIGSKLIKTIR